MEDRQFALLGNWSFIRGKPKGISVYSYNAEKGTLSHQETVLGDLYAGQQFWDKKNCVDYVVNEIGDRRGEIGGGGYVLALKVDPETGKIQLLNEKESLAPEPSYVYLDRSGRYLLIAHHVDGGHVTKIRKVDGKYISETQFDDAAVVLFRVNEDGSLGDACDVQVMEPVDRDGTRLIPHLHCVVADPTGELYAVCDKGTDRIYTFRIDRNSGTLKRVSVTEAAKGTAPRYLTFHPALPIVYVNHERNTEVSAYRYDPAQGITELLHNTQLLLDMEKAAGVERVEASDILLSPDAKRMYVTVRGVNVISTLEVDENGGLRLLQNEESRGDPRGLTFSPDGRFAFSCNMMAGTISTYTVSEDGLLTFRDNETAGVSPANLVFL